MVSECPHLLCWGFFVGAAGEVVCRFPWHRKIHIEVFASFATLDPIHSKHWICNLEDKFALICVTSLFGQRCVWIGHFGTFWDILGHFGRYFERFWPFLIVLDCFPVSFDYFCSFSASLNKSVTDRPTDQPTDGLTDQPTNQRTDTPSYRDAWTHLKI